MRLFCAMLLFGSGCAFGDDNVVDPGPDLPDMPDMDDMGELGDPEPQHLIAAVCEQRTWDMIPDTKHLDVAVVRTESGASVFGVPKDGGAVRGFRIDQRGDLFDREMIPIRDDQNYTAVSASISGGRLVLASVIDEKVTLDIVRDDLGALHGLGEFSGSLVTDLPVMTSRRDQVLITGGSFGLLGNGFTGALWEPTGEIEFSKAAISSITGAVYKDDAVFAYSTTTKECHLTRFASRIESVRDFGCENARLSMNERAGTGVLVFEEDGLIFRTDIILGGESELANKLRVAEQARSPRVVFDGTRHWISYINAHGDLVVGFVDDNGRLASRALEGTRPSDADAYDLAVFGNGVWVVDVRGETGFGAQRMCVRDQAGAEH